MLKGYIIQLPDNTFYSQNNTYTKDITQAKVFLNEHKAWLFGTQEICTRVSKVLQVEYSIEYKDGKTSWIIKII